MIMHRHVSHRDNTHTATPLSYTETGGGKDWGLRNSGGRWFTVYPLAGFSFVAFPVAVAILAHWEKLLFFLYHTFIVWKQKLVYLLSSFNASDLSIKYCLHWRVNVCKFFPVSLYLVILAICQTNYKLGLTTIFSLVFVCVYASVLFFFSAAIAIFLVQFDCCCCSYLSAVFPFIFYCCLIFAVARLAFHFI